MEFQGTCVPSAQQADSYNETKWTADGEIIAIYQSACASDLKLCHYFTLQTL